MVRQAAAAGMFIGVKLVVQVVLGCDSASLPSGPSGYRRVLTWSGETVWEDAMDNPNTVEIILPAYARPRGLAGKPLAGFCTTPSRRITAVLGVIVYAIRFKNPSSHR